VRHITVSVPGGSVSYQLDDDTTYIVDGCADGATISFDAHSSSNTDVANNAWVQASLNDTSTLCQIYVNSELSANGAAGIIFAEGLGVLPSSITLKKIENPPNNGEISAGNLVLHLMRVPHTEIYIPKSASDIPVAIDIKDTPCGGDVIISGAGASTAVNFIAAQSFVAVLRSRVVINSDVIAGRPGLFISGGDDNSAVFEIDFNEQFSVAHANGGCLTIDNDPAYTTVSKWLLERADNYSISVPETFQCDVLFEYISNAYLVDIPKAQFEYLGQKTTSDISVTRELGGIEIELIPGTLSNFSVLNQSSDGNIHVSYADGIGQFVVHSHTSVPEEGINVSVSDPGFAPNSQILLDCAESDIHYQWSLDPVEQSSPKSPLLTRLGFTSSGCSGVVSNIVGKNTLSGPKVILGDGFDSEFYVRSAPNAKSVVNGDNQRTLRLDTDSNKAHFYLLAGFESSVSEDDDGYTPPSLLDKYTLDIDTSLPFISNYEWPKLGIKNITIVLGDGKQYVWSQSSYITQHIIVNATVTKDTSVSFHISGTPPVSFYGTKSGTVKPSKSEISLVSSSSDIFCFDPVADCTAAAWARAASLDRLCPSPSSQEVCRSAARAALNVVSAGNALLYCGAASWDPTIDNSTNSTNSTPGIFSLNAAPKAQPAVLISQRLETAVSALVFASAILTVIGATALLPCLFRSCFCSKSPSSSSSLNDWWTSAAHRDAITDQFAWLPLIATAALSEARDADFLSWGGNTASLLLRTRRLVISWLRPCPSDSVSGPWLAPPFLIFALSLFISLALRLVYAIFSRKSIVPSRPVHTSLTALHSILSAACLLLLPHAVFLSAFLASSSAPYFYILPPVFFITVLLAQPMPSTSRSCIPPFLAAFTAAAFPACLALYAGIGSDTTPALAATASATFLATILQLVLLWKGFFRKAPRRGLLWRWSWSLVVLMRCFAAVSGIGFCAVLYLLGMGTFDEKEKTGQTISVVLWFIWVGLTWISSLPLMTATGPVLDADKRVAVSQSSRDLVTVPLLDEEDEDSSDAREREEENKAL